METKDHGDYKRIIELAKILYEGNPTKLAIVQKLPSMSTEELLKLEQILDTILANREGE